MKSFDYEAAMKVTDGDLELFGELIAVFDGQQKENIAELEAALASKDFAQFELVAHALKGALSNLGANAGVEIARALEGLGTQKDLDRAQALILELTQEISKFRAEADKVTAGRQ
jgi:HPt (histidine-containing phosphotransfer) domain-containing protein